MVSIIDPEKGVRDACSRLHTYFKDPDRIITSHNNEFMERVLRENRPLFDTIEKNPLDPRQREAIVCDEDRALVIAGAGTGKTTTIVGKVAYLVSKLGVPAGNILVLAFNKTVAQEMQERLGKRMKACLGRDDSFTVHTFHSFGLRVIHKAEGFKPDIEFSHGGKVTAFIGKSFERLLGRKEYRAIVNEYLLFYLRPVKTEFDFSTLEEYKAFLRENRATSMKGERMQSHEEVMIANFLFLNGINYEYERPYEHDTRSMTHRQYKPDFHLPDFGIYIEHCGIDRDGKVPKWFKGRNGMDPSETYQKKMAWASSLHERHGTRLVETYSYEIREGILFSKLTETLQGLGVTFTPKDDRQIIEHFEKNREIPLLVDLMSTFLSLQKGNQHDLSTLTKKAAMSDRTGKLSAFLKVYRPIYEEYQAYLAKNKAVDFSDMILKATNYITGGQYRSSFTHIIIDEFQDMSAGRYKLVQSLLDQVPEAKLFCVGDDWQSIYRFTGSDISLMTSFERHFGYAKKTHLEKTFRFNNKIAAVSGKFIQKNPRQIKKKLVTALIAHEPAVEIVYKERRTDQYGVLSILNDLNERAKRENADRSVLLLGRYDQTAHWDLDHLQRQYGRLRISFLTVHRAKGLEGDYAIIDNVIGGRLGFPCEIKDDPVLNLVLSEEESFENAEERRLFYVALTRAKYKVFVMTVQNQESKFIKELQDILAADGLWGNGAHTGLARKPAWRKPEPEIVVMNSGETFSAERVGQSVTANGISGPRGRTP